VKEIKAYGKRYLVTDLVDELNRAGAPGITIVEIHPVGYGYEPNYFQFEGTDVLKRYARLGSVKLEVVCTDEQLERLLRIIERTFRTGAHGDGRIFVADVAMAVRIREGVRGEAAL
jgi:nitrogen regulatory protein P-II 1